MNDDRNLIGFIVKKGRLLRTVTERLMALYAVLVFPLLRFFGGGSRVGKTTLHVDPETLGIPRLRLPVPANISAAFGYLGKERFIAAYEAFSRWHAPGSFIVEDSHEACVVDPTCWNLFCEHPAISPLLQRIGLDLKKQVRLPDRKLSEDELAEAFRGSRALLLDRLSGNLYFGRADNVRIYLMAVATETDDDETDSEVFEADLEGAAEYRSIPAHVVDDFRRSLDENFATPEAQWALGDWYLRRHDGSWALKLYDRASRRKTDLLEDYSNVASLGYACVLAREEERAIDAFKRAIEADPHNPEAYGHLALVQASRREAVEAQANARKAVEMAPDDPDSHIRLGQVLFMTDSANAGAEEVGKALALGVNADDLDDTQSILAGFWYRNQGLYLEARRCFEKVIAIDPTGHLAKEKSFQLGLAAVYIQLGEYEHAVNLAEICASSHSDPECIQILAISYLLAGRSDDGRAVLEKFLASSEVNKDSGSELVVGWSHAMFGEYPKAVEHLREAVRMEPKNLDARSELAKALWSSGHFDSAIQELVSARALGLTESEAEGVLNYFERTSDETG